MCSCDTATDASCYTLRWRVARKTHWCCECCRATILPGDRYEYVSGVWDGTPNSHSTCARCVALRKALIAALNPPNELYRERCVPAHECLFVDLRECARPRRPRREPGSSTHDGGPHQQDAEEMKAFTIFRETYRRERAGRRGVRWQVGPRNRWGVEVAA